MFLMMVLAAGMAVDFMRQEGARADLQNSLDRGTLAAADFTQSIANKQMIVEDYISSSNIRASNINLSVWEDSAADFSRVTAYGTYDIPTFFLKIAGINTLQVEALGSAEQRKRKIEISMVLDVSGSMGRDSTSAPGTKLAQLQGAANEFVDTILASSTLDDTSISIVPYSEYVRPSTNLAAQFNISTHHSYEYCVAFDHGAANNPFSLGDFTQMGISTITQFDQLQRIKTSGSKYACPRASNEIVALSNDAAALHNRIDALQSEGWTATYDGLKWGAALLDPNSNSVVQSLVTLGDIDPTLANRPLAWNTSGALKIIVLMTDGANTKQYEIKPAVYTSQTTSFWNANIPQSSDRNLLVDNGNNAKGDALMHSICQLAQSNNIIIYTIGFELTSDPSAAAALAQCASAPDHHFLVEGVQIASAFQTIAANIQKLKLIQ